MTQPLAELHLHLEGSLEPETLLAIDPSLSQEQIRSSYRFTDFLSFLNAYKWTVLKLQSAEHYAIAARHLRQRLTLHGVVYAEINLSVGVMLWRKQDPRPILTAVRKELGDWPLIFDAVRQHDPSIARQVAELALEFDAAFGIGGDESARPLSEFREAIRLAQDRFCPHAGETTDAANVWDAVRNGAKRIGHGIRASDDPELCAELRRNGIPLEVSVTSNVTTGAVPRLEDHPIRRLFDLGVPITVNTDDPALFATNLPREFEILQSTFGFSAAEVEQVRQNAFKYARAR